MTLAKQIDRWYRAGEHQETVKAILELAETDVTDALTEDLAVAYNNLGQYQKAIESLKAMLPWILPPVRNKRRFWREPLMPFPAL